MYLLPHSVMLLHNALSPTLIMMSNFNYEISIQYHFLLPYFSLYKGKILCYKDKLISMLH